jgi:hypothetical protein
MKQLYFLDEDEKNRILNLHESATKRQYLSEQPTFDFGQKTVGQETVGPKTLPDTLKSVVKKGLPGDPYIYAKSGDNYYYAKASDGDNPNWVLATIEGAIKDIKGNIFNEKLPPVTNIKSPVKGKTKVQPVKDKTKSTKTTTTVTGKDKFNFKYKDLERYQQTKDTTGETLRGFKQKTDKFIKSVQESIKLMGQVSKKTYNQLVSMIKKGTLKKYSFIVVNKDAAVVSLFGPNYKFITNSSITTGRVKDSGVDKKPDNSQKHWFEISLDYAKKNPNSDDGKKIKNWLSKYKNKRGLINDDGTVNWPVYLTLSGIKSIDLFPYSYTARSESGGDITPSGTFGISSGYNEPGYAGGQKGDENSFPLIDPDSVGTITPAIHGFASKKRGQLIDKAMGQGLNVSKDYTRAGAGCINVTPEFLVKMREVNPSYVIILPDTGGLVDVKITTFQNFKVKLTQLGSKCVRSLSSLFA